MGALCGAACVYGNYIHAIDIVEGGRHIRTVPGTAGIFATYPVRMPVYAYNWFASNIFPALLYDCRLDNVLDQTISV